MLTQTEAAKIEMAFKCALNAGDDFNTALDWCKDVMQDEHNQRWESSTAIWAQIRDIGKDIWADCN